MLVKLLVVVYCGMCMIVMLKDDNNTAADMFIISDSSSR